MWRQRSCWVAVALLALAGCSSSSGGAGDDGGGGDAQGTASAVFAITWPAASARLVPDVAASLTVRINGAGVSVEPQTVARPSAGGVSQLSFASLPAGTALTATINAYPSTDGSGKALATAAVRLTLADGETRTIDLDADTYAMHTTVEEFAIEPNPSTVKLADTVTLTVTAYNSDGAVLLMPEVTWSVTDGVGLVQLAVARQYSSQSIGVVGQAEGTATVQAACLQQLGDAASQLVASATVTVTGNTPDPSKNGLLSGRVFDTGDLPIEDAVLTVANTTATARTNEDGWFSFGEVATGELTLRIDADGHLGATRTVEVLESVSNRLAVHLAPLGVTRTIDPAVDNTITHHGASVVLPAGSIVTATGRQDAATAEVTVTAMLPSDGRFAEASPGRFAGLASSSRQSGAVPLESFGLVDLRITDGAGTELALADDAEAEVLWPIDDGHDPADGTLPIWTLDESTGVWTEDGFAIRDENAGVYRATVTHPGTCNLSRAVAALGTKQVWITVSAEPVAGVPCLVRGRGWAFGGVTDEVGAATMEVPADATADVLYLGRDGAWLVWREGEAMPSAGVVKINAIDLEAGDDLTPDLLTVQLVWDAAPEDLDANLTVPPNLPDRPLRYHVWFAREGSLASDPFARIETDDTTGYGPEIIAVRQGIEGVHRFCVHRFSDDGTLEGSGARVSLLLGDGRLYTFTPPESNPAAAEYWAVFDVVVDAGGAVTSVTGLAEYGGADLLLSETGARARK